MANEKAETGAMALAIVKREPAALEFTDEQKQLIKDMFGAAQATDAEFKVFLMVAQAKRLSPLTKQIHFVPRWDKKANRNKWDAQTGIDGLRSIAERTGLYEGQDEPQFEVDEQGFPVVARVTVYRKDRKPAIGVARYSEFVQMTWDDRAKDWRPNHMWAKMPFNQLAKCAEAQAIRKAFPGAEDAGGLYTADEVQALEDAPPAAPTVIDGDLVPQAATPETKPSEQGAPEKPTQIPVDDLVRWTNALAAATTKEQVDAIAREGNQLDAKDAKRADLAKLVGAARKRIGAPAPKKMSIRVEGDDGQMHHVNPEQPAGAAQGA